MLHGTAAGRPSFAGTTRVEQQQEQQTQQQAPISKRNIVVSKSSNIQGTLCTPLQQDLSSSRRSGGSDSVVRQRSRHLATHAAGHSSRQALVCNKNNIKQQQQEQAP
jgi:hypothetical protein